MNMNKKLLIIVFFLFLVFPLNVNANIGRQGVARSISYSCSCNVRDGILDCRNTNCTAEVIQRALQQTCGQGGTVSNVSYTCNRTPGSSPEEACNASGFTNQLSLSVRASAMCQGGVTPRVGDNFCADTQETMRFLGYLIFFAKIIIPFIVIFMGSLDLFKTVTTGKEDDMKKQFMILGKRILAGLMIFFIPTFLNLMFALIGGWADVAEDWERCAVCLYTPSKCAGGFTSPNTPGVLND